MLTDKTDMGCGVNLKRVAKMYALPDALSMVQE